MQRKIKLRLNEFPVVPHKLRGKQNENYALNEIFVDLARLYHHYYMDTRGVVPPDQDPAQFEHLSLLLPTSEFRVSGSGFGVSTAFRQHRSNELGQAFCRWFLSEHLNIIYFAHMEHVLNRQLHKAFGGCRIERTASGDAPDYFCAESVEKVFLAEAKGRISAVSFKGADFGQWREQFKRVVIKNPANKPRRMKGFIVATRFATESNRPSVSSTLFAEDPETQGDGPFEADGGLGAATIAIHYANIAAKLRQPVLSAALALGFTVPEEIRFPALVWEFATTPLQGMRFVGGYFPSREGVTTIWTEGRPQIISRDPTRLDVGSATFFGVEENIFLALVRVARGGEGEVGRILPMADLPPFYSAISLLRDGSIVGPVEFFSPVDRIVP